LIEEFELAEKKIEELTPREGETVLQALKFAVQILENKKFQNEIGLTELNMW